MLDPRDGLECDACGGCAIRPEFDGAYAAGCGGRCAECGNPGWVDRDALGVAVWVTDAPETERAP